MRRAACCCLGGGGGLLRSAAAACCRCCCLLLLPAAAAGCLPDLSPAPARWPPRPQAAAAGHGADAGPVCVLPHSAAALCAPAGRAAAGAAAAGAAGGPPWPAARGAFRGISGAAGGPPDRPPLVFACAGLPGSLRTTNQRTQPHLLLRGGLISALVSPASPTSPCPCEPRTKLQASPFAAGLPTRPYAFFCMPAKSVSYFPLHIRKPFLAPLALTGTPASLWHAGEPCPRTPSPKAAYQPDSLQALLAYHCRFRCTHTVLLKTGCVPAAALPNR